MAKSVFMCNHKKGTVTYVLKDLESRLQALIALCGKILQYVAQRSLCVP